MLLEIYLKNVCNIFNYDSYNTYKTMLFTKTTQLKISDLQVKPDLLTTHTDMCQQSFVKRIIKNE